MEHKLKKRFLDLFLIITTFFNGLTLILYFVYLLIGWDIISYRFIFLVKPIKVLSNNLLLILLIFGIELIVLCYYFLKFKKRIKLDAPQETTSEFEINNFFEPFEDQLVSEGWDGEISWSSLEIEDESSTSEEINIENGLDILTGVEAPLLIEETNEQKSYDDELSLVDNSPDFCLDSNQVDSEPIAFKSNRPLSTSLLVSTKVDPRLSLNDSQFAFYQRLLKEKWVYEVSKDRSRIKLSHHAIDEANISLSEINGLVKRKILYRRVMPHPSGSFVIYSTKGTVAKDIIYETIKKMIKGKSCKLINRKIEFPDWQNLDLIKKTWAFDFEIAPLQIIGNIWMKKIFRKSEIGEGGLVFDKEKKEELKALIATILMKFKKKGKILLITNSEKNAQKIKNLCKEISQVTIEVLSFSDKRFKDHLDTILV
ncbi:MAG: hypothetical protein GF308_15605 [Candidatus Heimdallarchaeota archaeon]|nr:hypothetical protein [Candidatus Heimdallarchaeota archaeon]